MALQLQESLLHPAASAEALGDAPLSSGSPGASGADADAARHLCGGCACWRGIPLTNNVKALATMMFMFALISLGQYFAAVYCGSQALKADVVSMSVDAVSYLGNILGESAGVPAQRIVLQLVFSLLSLVLLLYFNTTTIIESIDGLEGGDGEEDPPAAHPDAEGTLVVVFAGIGLIFDFVCLYAYYHFAKKDAAVEHEARQRRAALLGEEGREISAGLRKPPINMFSALMHVSADLFRSAATLVLGVLIASGALDRDQSKEGDGVLAVTISATLYVAAAVALLEWCRSCFAWFAGLGEPLEVVCPPGSQPGDVIRIEPTRAVGGRAADAFLG